MLLIFDLDDTLVHTHQKAYEKTAVTADSFGLSLTFEDFFKSYGKMSFSECLNFWFGEINSTEFRRRYNTIREDFPYEPIGDVFNLLLDLSSSNDIGILTNSTQGGTKFKLRNLGLIGATFLSFVYHNGNLIKPKPDAAQIERIVESGYSRSDIVYIGDNVRDFEFASNGNVLFHGVLTGLTTRRDFEKAGVSSDTILNDVHDLKRIY
jgi:HAD superfamily hydrolase (TIGR01549 family)